MDQTATGPDRIAVELAADLDAGFAALFEAHQNVLCIAPVSGHDHETAPASR